MKKKTLRRKNRAQRLLESGTLANKFNDGVALRGANGVTQHVDYMDAVIEANNAKKTYLATKQSTILPYYVKDAVINRSGSRCEIANCDYGNNGLDYCHIVHRGMGGRKGEYARLINDPRNVAHLCRKHHDMLDRREKCDTKYWQWMLDYLKQKLGHDSWVKDYQELLKS